MSVKEPRPAQLPRQPLPITQAGLAAGFTGQMMWHLREFEKQDTEAAQIKAAMVQVLTGKRRDDSELSDYEIRTALNGVPEYGLAVNQAVAARATANMYALAALVQQNWVLLERHPNGRDVA